MDWSILLRYDLRSSHNKKQCIPQLIALTTDHIPAIAKKANHLLTYVDEKYPTFVHLRVLDGIKFSFSFQRSVFGKCLGKTVTTLPDAIAFTSGEPAFASLYLMFKKRNKHNFLLNLLKVFEEPGEQVLTTDSIKLTL